MMQADCWNTYCTFWIYSIEEEKSKQMYSVEWSMQCAYLNRCIVTPNVNLINLNTCPSILTLRMIFMLYECNRQITDYNFLVFV